MRVGTPKGAPTVGKPLGAISFRHRSDDAAALFAAMTVQPNAGRQVVINTLISALKAAGVWTLFDFLYVTAAHDAQAARLNWVSPSTFTLTGVNAPTFTVDKGYNGNGTTSYLGTGFTPSLNASKIGRIDAHYGVWCPTSFAASDAEVLFGSGALPTNNSRCGICLRSASGRLSSYTHSNNVVFPVNAETKGLGLVTRTSASNITTYKDATSLGNSSSNAAATITDREILLCADASFSAVGTFTFATNIVSAAMGGSQLSAGQEAGLYNALLSYMTSVGNV